MKAIQKILFVVFVVAVTVLIFVPVAFALQDNPVVQLPTEGETLVQAFFVMVLTGLAKLLFAKTKIDISGSVALLAAAISTFVVVLLNAFLAQIPDPFANLANVLLGMLITWLAGLGFFAAWKHFVAQPLKLKKLKD